jgi:short-subunit dehydrogenase
MTDIREGKGRTALITGASAGIGKAFAHEFARHGFDLILTARREDRLKALADELTKEHGVNVHVIADDLADPGAPGRIVSWIDGQGLTVDALVNNAGYAVPGVFTATQWEDQQRFIQVLVTAGCELAHRLMPGMIERKYGRIINVASLAGIAPGTAGHTLYGASKAFMIKFSQSLHLEGERHNVFASALCPGFTYSEFHDVTGVRGEVSKLPKYMWMDAAPVVAQGYRAVMQGKTIHVPGGFNKFVAFLARVLPGPVALNMVRRRSRQFRKQEG